MRNWHDAAANTSIGFCMLVRPDEIAWPTATSHLMPEPVLAATRIGTATPPFIIDIMRLAPRQSNAGHCVPGL
jgi:hypothetical protein